MSERGSATVIALAVVTILLMVSAALVAVGRMVGVQIQATAAADAAALAAAPLTFLPGDPRAEASRFAALNATMLVACRCPTDPSFRVRTVTVEVAREVDLPLFGPVTVRGRAAAEFDPMDLLAARGDLPWEPPHPNGAFTAARRAGGRRPISPAAR